MSFEAKYPGACAGCAERIEVGDPITYVEDAVVHQECDGLPPMERKVEVCTECWLTKPCDCEDNR